MTENKKRNPYVKPSMEVIKVETMSILAGSGPEMSSARSNEWVKNEIGPEDLDWD